MLAASLLFAASARAAGPRPLEVTFSPEAPTWRDAVTVSVAGTVVTSCGPGIVHLAAQWQPGATFIDAFLTEDDCPLLAPPTAQPFVASAVIGRLPSGLFNLVVHDEAQGTVLPNALWIADVGTLELILPAAAPSGEPVVIRVRGTGSCPAVTDLEVAGDLITISVDAYCEGFRQPATAFELEPQVGPLPPGDYRVRLLDLALGHPLGIPRFVKGAFRVWNAAGCVPSDTALCLLSGRFRLAATWRDFAARSGVGHAVPLPGNEGSGLLWFFAADNAELTVKVLDGCGLNGHRWVFLSSSSTVEYELTVTDTADGSTRTYRNELGQVPQLIADTSAFACP